MKSCPACKREMPRSAFGTNAARKDGLQSYCRTYRRAFMRRHYALNATAYRASAAKRNLQRHP